MDRAIAQQCLVQCPDASFADGRVEPLTSAESPIFCSEERSRYPIVLQPTDVSSPARLGNQTKQILNYCRHACFGMLWRAITAIDRRKDRSNVQDATANDVAAASPGIDGAVRR
jgi:hypothetical protein